MSHERLLLRAMLQILNGIGAHFLRKSTRILNFFFHTFFNYMFFTLLYRLITTLAAMIRLNFVWNKKTNWWKHWTISASVKTDSSRIHLKLSLIDFCSFFNFLWNFVLKKSIEKKISSVFLRKSEQQTKDRIIYNSISHSNINPVT